MGKLSFKNASAIADMFGILSNPIRVCILISLSERPKRFKEIRQELSIPQPLLSQHMSILRKAGVIEHVDNFNLRSPCRIKDKLFLEIIKLCSTNFN